MPTRPEPVLFRLARAWRNSAAGRWWRYDCTLVVYRMERPSRPDPPAFPAFVGRNDRAHLACYVAAGRYLDRAEFLASSERRMAAGELVYTICPADRLLAYAWMVPNQESSWLSAVRFELRYPPRSCVLYNAFTLPEARGRGYNTLLARERLADAFLRFGADAVFASVQAGNEHAQRAKIAVGLRAWREIRLSTRLGHSVTTERDLWQSPPEPISAATAATPPGIDAIAASTAANPRGT